MFVTINHFHSDGSTLLTAIITMVLYYCNTIHRNGSTLLTAIITMVLSYFNTN